MPNNIQIASKMLKWYDKNARKFPWRIPPKESRAGVRLDPYRVWLSEIMLQQTTVQVVKSYYELFLSTWPTITDLATANEEEILEAWAGLGYYQRARNLIACARIVVKDHNGVFPQDEKLLLNLPGIGDYTSAAIRCISFNQKANVIDTNISRVISRIFAINTPITRSSKEIKACADFLLPSKRFGDYAQALMDLGSLLCTPKNPRCSPCPIKKVCASYERGISNQIPYFLPKKSKLIKYGYVYVTFTNKNDIILERRPNFGLLGGMLCFPSSEWEPDSDIAFVPPFNTKWKTLNDSVTHEFSHFKLKLKIARGVVDYVPPNSIVRSLKTFNRNSLPTLMRKVFDIAITHSP